MRTFYSILLVVTAMVLALPTAVPALEVVYPADKTVVSRSDFLIIKGGSQPVLEELTVEVNGVVSDPLDISADEYKSAFADFLILEPSWNSGKNNVVVKGFVGGKAVSDVRAEFVYNSYTDPIAILPPGFKHFVMHTPEKESLCVPCHKMNPTTAELKGAADGANPCAACHSRMFDQKFVHGPEGVFQCIDCHDSGGKLPRWQVTKADLDLCGECHIDKIDDFKKNKFVHGPVATGNCIICHNPHASQEPYQLNASTNLLCLGCHDSVAKGEHVVRGVSGKGHPLTKVRDPLRPEKMLSCVSCHDPHGSAGASLFQGDVEGRFALCQRCHKK